MKILFIGDIVGKTGRKAIKIFLPQLKKNYKIDLIIANGENAAGGFGLTKKIAEELFSYGIDCLTLGNHTWNNKDIMTFIDNEPRIIRPLNYIPGLMGRGWTIIKINNYRVAVINLLGQVFMGTYNSPFMVYDKYISMIKNESDIILIDFHAEATGEKLVFANYVDGNVSCVVGTHTHVQTADEMILPGGTAYITDLGFTGAIDSILGMTKKTTMERLITQIPRRLKVAIGNSQLAGLLVTIDEITGFAKEIMRIHEIE